jgi:hypothetical protein
MISCILATAREPYPIIGLESVHVLEPTLCSLEKQSFRDFELVIVDALYPEKRGWIESRKWSFPIKYVPVHTNHRFWLDRSLWNVAGMLNTALLYVEGDLIVRIDDASEILDVNYLQKFWNAYQNGYFALAMHTRYRGGKQAYYNEEYRREGYEIAREPPSRKDILLNFFKEGDPVRDTRWPTVEMHGRMVAPPEWFYGFSSFSLEAALKVNGFNELFDGCLPPSQLILGVETKPIESIREGDFVFTHRGRLRQVKRIFKRYYKGPIVKIHACGVPPILLTPEHPLLVRSPKWTGRKTKRGFDEAHSFTGWKKAFDLYRDFQMRNKWAHRRRKFRLIFPAPTAHTWTEQLNVGRYRLKLTEGLARLLGYYVAEGSGGGRYMELSFGSDQREFAEDAKILYNKELGFLKRRNKASLHGSICKASKSRAIEVKFNAGDDFLQALKQVVGKNAREKRIPYAILLNANLAVCKEFLEGLWRGDGCGDKYFEGKYVTTSLQLAHQVRLLLARLGIYSAISKFVQKDGYGKGRDIFSVNVTHSKTRYHVKRASSVLGYSKGNYFYLPIRKIELVDYNGYVYNLEVEEDQSYLVYGVAVHNCKGQEDQDFGIRLSMAGYKNLFLLDKDLWVIEHEHLPCVVKSPEPFKCNYGLIQYEQVRGLFRANSWKLTLEDCEWIRRCICSKCSNYDRCLNETLKGQFYVDNELFRLWLNNQGVFDLRAERLEVA